MPNTAGYANSFQAEILQALHALGDTVARATTARDGIKAALYLATANIGPSTTAYTGAGEAIGAGYTAGGVVVPNSNSPSLDGNVGIWTPSSPIVFPGITVSNVDAILLYNATQGNRAIAVLKFSAQTLVAGTLTVAMPANTSAVALIRVRK